MEKKRCIRIKTNDIYRYEVEDEGTVFVYAPRKSTKGWRFTKEQFSNYFIPIDDSKKESDAWKRRINKAVKAMESSGLWSANLLPIFKEISKLDYSMVSKYKEAYNKWDRDYYSGKNQVERPKVEDYLPNELKGLYKAAGYDLGTYLECKLKAPYFGKGITEQERRSIEEAMQKHQDYYDQVSVPNYYDVSFSYNAEKNQAWYSEEYKGTGNGHYYLLLSPKVALFYEND